MVSFDSFTLCGGVPIYQQILLYLKRGAVSGAIADGDELPSRRVLSALLGVNPNTVQKACRLMEEGRLDPALVIGVPVGFVNVVESKELLCAAPGEHIVAMGRKGGSNIAAAICNALLYMASGNARE